MENIVLEATHRTVTGKKVKVLRREGKLPAVLYGHGLEPTPILMDLKETSQVLSSVGASTLVTIDLEGKKHTALVRDRQHEVIYRTLLHVDFQALSMTETVRAEVAVVLSDEEAPAVKNYGAMIISGLDQLEIECLPGDLIDRIVVDVSTLEEIGDTILVKDLPIPSGITVLGDPETMVAVASALAEEVGEEEEEVLEDLDLAAEPEVIEKGKQDEEDE